LADVDFTGIDVGEITAEASVADDHYGEFTFGEEFGEAFGCGRSDLAFALAVWFFVGFRGIDFGEAVVFAIDDDGVAVDDADFGSGCWGYQEGEGEEGSDHHHRLRL